jgi:glycosyl transferase family 25
VIGHAILWLRWQLRSRVTPPTVSPPTRVGVDRCRIVYINLDRRPERRAEIEGEFQRLGIAHAQRLVASDRPNGALGCAESHAAALAEWDPRREALLMVCEDDAVFRVDRARLDRMIETFIAEPALDVLCLGFNVRNEIPISETMSLTSNTQTTSCYVLKGHMRDPLLVTARGSIASFTSRRRGVHIDRAWKGLQRRWFFAIPRFRAVVQRASFSDVEGRFVEYRV